MRTENPRLPVLRTFAASSPDGPQDQALGEAVLSTVPARPGFPAARQASSDFLVVVADADDPLDVVVLFLVFRQEGIVVRIVTEIDVVVGAGHVHLLVVGVFERNDVRTVLLAADLPRLYVLFFFD